MTDYAGRKKAIYDSIVYAATKDETTATAWASIAAAGAQLLAADQQRLANMIAWYHVIPESDRGRKLREQIEQELDL